MCLVGFLLLYRFVLPLVEYLFPLIQHIVISVVYLCCINDYCIFKHKEHERID
jgi:hypothetical protein